MSDHIVIGEPQVYEETIRQWFKTVDLDQARDTFRVVEGILEMRAEAQPKRARRKDAGKPRPQTEQAEIEQQIDLRELGQK